MRSPNDILQTNVAAMVDVSITAEEIKIYIGCNRCGRRVVQDGKPIEGAMILRRQGISTGGEVLCGDCYKEAKP